MLINEITQTPVSADLSRTMAFASSITWAYHLSTWNASERLRHREQPIFRSEWWNKVSLGLQTPVTARTGLEHVRHAASAVSRTFPLSARMRLIQFLFHIYNIDEVVKAI
jgi:hypothetical protein